MSNVTICLCVTDFNDCSSSAHEIWLTHTKHIRYFSKNSDEFIAFVNRLNIMAEIMCFSETWFRQKSITEITGYNSFHAYKNNVGMEVESQYT
mgnify:CR=1 FL=1